MLLAEEVRERVRRATGWAVAACARSWERVRIATGVLSAAAAVADARTRRAAGAGARVAAATPSLLLTDEAVLSACWYQ